MKYINNISEELINNILHAGSEENARKAIDIYTAQVEEAVLEKKTTIEELEKRVKNLENILVFSVPHYTPATMQYGNGTANPLHCHNGSPCWNNPCGVRQKN